MKSTGAEVTAWVTFGDAQAIAWSQGTVWLAREKGLGVGVMVSLWIKHLEGACWSLAEPRTSHHWMSQCGVLSDSQGELGQTCHKPHPYVGDGTPHCSTASE